MSSLSGALEIASCTDPGMVRAHNEDSIASDGDKGLVVLADGMGGEAHGEIASALAVETVVKHCLDEEANPAAKVLGKVEPGWSARTKRLSTALHYVANGSCPVVAQALRSAPAASPPIGDTGPTGMWP